MMGSRATCGVALVALIMVASVFVHPAATGLVSPEKWGTAERPFPAATFDAPSHDRFVPGEFIVTLRPGFTTDSDALAQMEAETIRPIVDWRPASSAVEEAIARHGLDRTYLLRIAGEQDAVESRAAMLAADPSVESIHRNAVLQVSTSHPIIPNDALLDRQWYLSTSETYPGLVTGLPYSPHIDAPTAWGFDGGRTGLDFPVAVLDTGIDYLHPDLIQNMWADPIFANHGYDFVNGDADPMDDHGHGTAMAGIIGASTNNGIGIAGVSWSAQLAAFKTCDAYGSCPVSALISGILLAIDLGFRVLNGSWGGFFVHHYLLQVAFDPESIGPGTAVLLSALAAANEVGALVVLSAGNLSLPGIVDSFDIDVVHYVPASFPLPNTIVVTETDASDNRLGNYGSTSVDLGAPGSLITTTLPGGEYGSVAGSSASTAVVTGAVALYWSYNMHLPSAEEHLEIKARLLDRTEKVPSLTGVSVSGGRLNLCMLFEACLVPFPPIQNL